MVDFFDNYDEIEFLESEIEDDDPDAPVGSLFDVVEGKVCPVAQKTQPAPAETVVEETVPAGEEQAPVVQEVAAVEEEPVPVEEPAPEPVAEERAEEPVSVGEPAPEPVAAVETPSEPAPADDASAYGTELPIGIYVPSAVGSEPAPAEPAPVEEVAVEEPAPAPAPVEEQVAEEPAPAPAPKKKKTATKAARTTIQPAADEGNIWGAAVISGAPKKKAVSEEEKPSAIAEETPAASSESEKSKEETEVAKDKAPAKEAKKPATKTAAKPAAKTAAKPAAKTAAKPAAKKEAPAKTAAKKPAAAKETAKPATKPATKPENEEQIIEAGDASAPHGKFVIKKTDKGHFVYKLYSSNYRVVAIGAEPYSSLSACKSGIASVRNNAATAPIEDQTLQKWEELKFPKWQIYTDKKGEIRLRLLASNGNIVATTNDGYLSKEAAKKGIAAIGRAAKGSDIVRNDNLW